MKGLLLGLVCLVSITICTGQESKDRSSYTIDVSQLDKFHLYNRRGAVTVKATSGNTATMQVTRYLKAKSSAKLEEAKKNIYLDSTMINGELVFFVVHPDMQLEFDEERGFAGYDHSNRYRNRGWNNKNDHVKVEFTITLELPARMNLSVLNHEHPLKVSGMQGEVKARNHHDGVLVEGQGGNASVHSHHGNVEVYYTKNPTSECSYGTHHGDIKVHFKSGLSADASLYSYHGDFYSEFDWAMKPMSVAEQGRRGAKYKVKSKGETNVKIGSGGSEQRFRTHHGDVYLLSN